MQRPCDSCGSGYEARRPNSRFCSPKCRKRAQRAPAGESPPRVPVALHPMISAATGRELTAAGRLESSLGQAALALARRIDGSAFDSGSSLAALTREWRMTLAAAVEGVPLAASPLDELKAKRDARRGA